jgi:hypothetical protein
VPLNTCLLMGDPARISLKEEKVPGTFFSSPHACSFLSTSRARAQAGRATDSM